MKCTCRSKEVRATSTLSPDTTPSQNKNWTTTWGVGKSSILRGQNYSHEDDLAHITSLLPAFRDPRYIRVNGRPLFLVYRTGLLPDPKRTAEIWREAAIRTGVGDLYLVRVERFARDVDPASIGFDATVEFAPDADAMVARRFHDGLPGFLSRHGIISRAYAQNRVVRYADLAKSMLSRPMPEFKRFRCVTPMWDNSARRKQHAWILVDSTPELYQNWLETVAAQTREHFQGDERLVFINAWNEWAEGNHLEPDLKWGRAYLEATQNALCAAAARPPSLA